jgi:disulfide bond formation protein DsbB
MYPIAVLAGLALFYKEKATIAKYILALSIPGAIIALYHYAIQMNIIQSILPGCSFASPCTETQIMWLGFITIPLLSFGAFLVITLLVGNYLYRNRG